jgi:acyl CoA:acetate/3-ketoacid CoA transferase beta subunit
VRPTVDEQIAWCLACCCRAGDVLVVGVATPLAAAAGQLARALLVPDLVLIEAAAVDVAPHDVATPMVQPEVIAAEAVGVYAQIEILDAIQRGRITLQFVSPAQVDGAGNLNTSRVRATDGTMRRLPGGLAHADIACLIGRLVAYRAAHEQRFLPEQVDFVTGAAGRVGTIVTSAAVLSWDGEAVPRGLAARRRRGAGGRRLWLRLDVPAHPRPQAPRRRRAARGRRSIHTE